MALDAPGERVVIGPSIDGGYYLVGLKRGHRRPFEDVSWSSPEVVGQTLERARELSPQVHLLPEWYDVDDARSLRLLCRELFRPRNVAVATGVATPALLGEVLPWLEGFAVG